MSAWDEDTPGRFSRELDDALTRWAEDPLEPHEDVRQRVLLWVLERGVAVPRCLKAFARRIVPLFLRNRRRQPGGGWPGQLGDADVEVAEAAPGDSDIETWLSTLRAPENSVVASVLEGETWAGSCALAGVPTGTRYRLRRRLETKLSAWLALT